jgi:hypothetical protein
MTTTYPKTLQMADLTGDATVELPAGKYTELAVYQVGYKEMIAFGNGKIWDGSADDRGTFKLAVKTGAGVDIPGTARLEIADSHKVNPRFIREDISADVNTGVKMGIGGKTGREKNSIVAGERAYLVIKYCPGTTATATKANCTTSMPVTISLLD